VDISTWIVIYLPLFIIFLIVLPQQNSVRKMIIMKKKRKGGRAIMPNELLKKYIGKNCIIYTGSFGTNVMGKIIEVNENWIEVETKKNVELINVEYVQNIRIVNK